MRVLDLQARSKPRVCELNPLMKCNKAHYLLDRLITLVPSNMLIRSKIFSYCEVKVVPLQLPVSEPKATKTAPEAARDADPPELPPATNPLDKPSPVTYPYSSFLLNTAICYAVLSVFS